MESPSPSSRYVARTSKKRVFPGGSSSSGFNKEVEILETTPSSKIMMQPMSSKKKEVVCEIIDLDIEEDCHDVMVIDGEADRKGKDKGKGKGKGKGKAKEISSVDVSNLSNHGSGNDIKTSKNVDSDDAYSNLFFGEDEWIDTYYDDISFDDHSYFETQFDHMDLPPGVEVPFPWLQIESKDQTTTSSKSIKGSLSDKQLVKEQSGPMLLETGRDWKKESSTKNNTAYLSSQSSGGTESYKPENVPSLYLRKGKRKSFGPGGHDSAHNQNLDEEHFKKFDTVEDCSDHYYVNEGSSSKQVRPPKNWAKRIQEEWKILEKDLPDTIFVRVYESRMDLLRAVIVGSEGTPYHDGLFFFDILFPGGYPNDPPKVHYHSGGLRINPNLYNCGKVCLSLLGTWSGRSPKEKWIPGVSTMLQVLVSIQGLILNAEPYFNEPGYERYSGTASGGQRSLQYNETTFMYSLQTMVYTMKRPPKHFEALVVGHFCKHARDILVSCKAYLDGAQVGCLVRGGVQDVDEGDKACSQDFKSKLAGFITTLVNTFSSIGAKDCEEFLSLGRNANGRAAAATHRAVKSRKK